MEQNTLRKQRELTDRLNRYRNEYYNYNNSSVSDEVYDRLFDELHKLEQETGIQMSNSPTVTVGYPVVGKLEKTAHKIPLLSLDKVKSSVDLCRFMGEHQVMIMLKLDGLTIKLTYENGELVEAATRGDGDEGEIVTHNARAISGIPAHIQYPGRLVVTGEAFIRPRDFERLNTSIVDENGETYKNGRNLAAGSVRLRDAGECMERCVTFMPFNVLEGFDDLPRKSERLKEIRPLGFTPCKYLVTKRPLTQAETEDGIKQLQQYAKDSDIPIDGIVVTYNDIAFSKRCGRTGHHYKDGLAFKFEDELFKTTLRSIEWTPGRTGEIAPVAIFAPVEIEGRDENGKERIIKTLFCDNATCETRKLKKFVHFVSKKAMNIEGLSEATLEKLIGRGWIHSYLDLYRLDQHRDEIIRMEGFGVKSWQRLWDAVQQSRNTTFERYVIAMDIPMIGNTASGVLCREFHGSLEEFRDAVYTGYDFRQLPDFGETLHNNIHEWFCNEENFCIWEELQMMMNIQKPAAANNQAVGQDTPFAGKNIVVTGKVEPYTRDEMNSLIASLGAVAGSSVSRKTDYLVCGEKAGSKLSKAQELGIRVLTPNEFFNMAGVA